MNIYGKLLPSGELVEIYQRQVEADDVPLSAIPSFHGPFGYDAETQTAIPMPATLDQVKTAAYASVDLRTQQLLVAGFSYAPAGQSQTYSFGLTVAEQTVWLGTFVAASFLTYPLEIGTADNLLASLQSEADVQAFYAAGVTRMHVVLSGAIQLKATIMGAIDAAGVAAVVDTR